MNRGFFLPLFLSIFCSVNAGADISEAAAREYAARLARSLDDRTLAAQILLTGIDGKGVLGGPMKTLLQQVPAGGILLFKYNLSVEKIRVAPFLASVVQAASIQGKLPEDAVTVPPFVAVDHEGGWVHRFDEGVSRLPAPGAFWEMAQGRGQEAALEYVESTARTSGSEIRSMGITMNLAPVAEVLTKENRAFLDDRSYGPNPFFVEKAAAAFIRGMETAGIICVVKHFPGNTGVDPHEGAVTLSTGREALDLMIAPMIALIRSGIPAVMVSHVLVPAWDSARIASLSPLVIGTWLRRELGFAGIVLADDFSMGAAAASGLTPEAAAVAALNAGVDMVMTWPMNLTAVHTAILRALQDGRLSRERLVEAAGRILYEKIRRGIISLPGLGSLMPPVPVKGG
jgi:beta-N-acetylhexosaminidase